MRCDEIRLISSEVGCCVSVNGERLWVYWFKVSKFEPCRMVAMISPLWSLIDECHSGQCAFMSPAMREFGMFASLVNRAVMRASSISWTTVLGGIKTLVMVRLLVLISGISMV